MVQEALWCHSCLVQRLLYHLSWSEIAVWRFRGIDIAISLLLGSEIAESLFMFRDRCISFHGSSIRCITFACPRGRCITCYIQRSLIDCSWTQTITVSLLLCPEIASLFMVRDGRITFSGSRNRCIIFAWSRDSASQLIFRGYCVAFDGPEITVSLGLGPAIVHHNLRSELTVSVFNTFCFRFTCLMFFFESHVFPL